MMVGGWFDCWWMYIDVFFGFAVGAVFAGFEAQCKVQEVDSFQVGDDRDSQPEALEKCSYFLPGMVCLTSRKVSEYSEPIVSVQPYVTILILLGQLREGEQANQLTYLCPVEAPNHHIKEAAIGPFPPCLALTEE